MQSTKRLQKIVFFPHLKRATQKDTTPDLRWGLSSFSLKFKTYLINLGTEQRGDVKRRRTLYAWDRLCASLIKWSSLFISLDTEKAFDSVQWEYLCLTLIRFDQEILSVYIYQPQLDFKWSLNYVPREGMLTGMSP